MTKNIYNGNQTSGLGGGGGGGIQSCWSDDGDDPEHLQWQSNLWTGWVQIESQCIRKWGKKQHEELKLLCFCTLGGGGGGGGTNMMTVKQHSM